MAHSVLLPLLASAMAPASGADLLTDPQAVGATPALGWNSWNRYRAELDETVVKATADALVSSGLAAKGYTVRVLSAVRVGATGTVS